MYEILTDFNTRQLSQIGDAHATYYLFMKTIVTHLWCVRASAFDDSRICDMQLWRRLPIEHLNEDWASGGADHYQVKAGLICMQAAAQPPGFKAKMAWTLNVEQAIDIMADTDTEPETDLENEGEYSESECWRRNRQQWGQFSREWDDDSSSESDGNENSSETGSDSDVSAGRVGRGRKRATP